MVRNGRSVPHMTTTLTDNQIQSRIYSTPGWETVGVAGEPPTEVLDLTSAPTMIGIDGLIPGRQYGRRAKAVRDWNSAMRVTVAVCTVLIALVWVLG